jgi:hypothetical protein
MTTNMPDKLKELEEGDKVQLRGPCGKEWFEVVKDRDKVTIRVKAVDGGCFLAHKSRITAVVKKGSDVPQPEGQAEAMEEEKEEPVSEAAVAEKPAKSKTAAKPAAKAKQAKAVFKPKPFDLNAYIKVLGGPKAVPGVHMVKPSGFDHVDYKAFSHVCIDEKGGHYYTFNTYVYPDGTESLGKKEKGGNSYPLKGHRHTVTKKLKNGKVEKLQQPGQMTAEEKVEQYKKKGYKQIPRSAKSSAVLAAIKAPAPEKPAAEKPQAAVKPAPQAAATATPAAKKEIPVAPPAEPAPEPTPEPEAAPVAETVSETKE